MNTVLSAADFRARHDERGGTRLVICGRDGELFDDCCRDGMAKLYPKVLLQMCYYKYYNT